jgi:hypothetical protein
MGSTATPRHGLHMKLVVGFDARERVRFKTTRPNCYRICRLSSKELAPAAFFDCMRRDQDPGARIEASVANIRPPLPQLRFESMQ